MANQTQIANLALSWMGQQLINDLNDNQTEAKVLKANFDLSRDVVLEDHAWTFALDRQVLSPVVPGPAFGTQQRFLIPSDVIRVHRVFRPTNASQTRDLQNARWVREGQYILAAELEIWAYFIMRISNTDRFSPGFVHSLAARLAADTAMTLTENNRLQEKMEVLYDAKLSAAAYADGSQGRTEVLKSDQLTGVRRR